MTNQEVIKTLKEKKSMCQLIAKSYGIGSALDIDFICFDKAIEALEKHIPKKPLDYRLSCEIGIGKCPSCGEGVDRMINPFYCTNKNCLQRLDWEVEE